MPRNPKDIRQFIKTIHDEKEANWNGDPDRKDFLLADLQRRIYENPGSADYTDDSNTPLTIATEFDLIDVIKLLLRNDANVNPTFKNALPPLIHAITKGNNEIIQLLLENGATFDLDKNKKLLENTVEKGMVDTLNLLAEKIPELADSIPKNYSLLRTAIKKEQKEMAEFLIRKGIDVNKKEGKGKLLPLTIAVGLGYEEMVRFLLERGADVNIQDNDSTPLHIAVVCGFLEITKLLLEKKLNIDEKDGKGYTPLDKAIDYLDKNVTVGKNDDGVKNAGELIALLIENDATFDPGSNKNKKFFARVAKEGKVDTLKLLLEKIPELAKSIPENYSLLRIAIRKKQKEMAEFLIDKGVDVNKNEGEGKQLPLAIAVELGYEEMVKLLLKKEADVNIQGSYSTPLHIAVMRGFLGITSLLLDKKPNIDEKDRGGQTALDIAIDSLNDDGIPAEAFNKNNDELVALLLKNGATFTPSIPELRNLLKLIATKGLINTLKLLIEKEIHDKESNEDLNTNLLRVAIRYRQKEIAECLIDNGADVNVERKKSYLFMAVEDENEEIVKLLLENKAEVDTTNGPNKELPLQVAVEVQNKKIVD